MWKTKCTPDSQASKLAGSCWQAGDAAGMVLDCCGFFRSDGTSIWKTIWRFSYLEAFPIWRLFVGLAAFPIRKLFWSDASSILAPSSYLAISPIWRLLLSDDFSNLDAYPIYRLRSVELKSIRSNLNALFTVDSEVLFGQSQTAMRATCNWPENPIRMQFEWQRASADKVRRRKQRTIEGALSGAAMAARVRLVYRKKNSEVSTWVSTWNADTISDQRWMVTFESKTLMVENSGFFLSEFRESEFIDSCYCSAYECFGLLSILWRGGNIENRRTFLQLSPWKLSQV